MAREQCDCGTEEPLCKFPKCDTGYKMSGDNVTPVARIPTLDATKEADRAKALQIVREATNLRMRASILLRNTDDELTKDFLMHALGADQ